MTMTQTQPQTHPQTQPQTQPRTHPREVLLATPEDRDRCTATFVAAFGERPADAVDVPGRRPVPRPAFPQVIRHYGGTAFDLGTAYRTDDVAGRCLLARARRVRRRGVARRCPRRLDRARTPRPDLRVHGAGRRVAPRGPITGTCRASASTRRGRARDSARCCSPTPSPRWIVTAGVAYLESSNPLNVPLYERFGFEVIAEIQAGDSPAIWPMLRPRAGHDLIAGTSSTLGSTRGECGAGSQASVSCSGPVRHGSPAPSSRWSRSPGSSRPPSRRSGTASA